VDVLDEICERWQDEVEKTRGNRFRCGTDAVLRI
jgi:hypothetical protein